MYEALISATGRIRRFFGVTTLFAVIVGVLDTVLLLLILDVPLAPLWGLLAAVCNYVPYLGFWVGMVPPLMLGLVLHGWGAFVTTLIAYLVLNFVVTSLIPTKFIGDAVGMSMVLEVVSIVFWGWVLGPLGAIWAIPLTIVVKAVLIDSDPRARWLAGFLDSGKAVRRAAAE